MSMVANAWWTPHLQKDFASAGVNSTQRVVIRIASRLGDPEVEKIARDTSPNMGQNKFIIYGKDKEVLGQFEFSKEDGAVRFDIERGQLGLDHEAFLGDLRREGTAQAIYGQMERTIGYVRDDGSGTAMSIKSTLVSIESGGFTRVSAERLGIGTGSNLSLLKFNYKTRVWEAPEFTPDNKVKLRFYESAIGAQVGASLELQFDKRRIKASGGFPAYTRIDVSNNVDEIDIPARAEGSAAPSRDATLRVEAVSTISSSLPPSGLTSLDSNAKTTVVPLPSAWGVDIDDEDDSKRSPNQEQEDTSEAVTGDAQDSPGDHSRQTSEKQFHENQDVRSAQAVNQDGDDAGDDNGNTGMHIDLGQHLPQLDAGSGLRNLGLRKTLSWVTDEELQEHDHLPRAQEDSGGTYQDSLYDTKDNKLGHDGEDANADAEQDNIGREGGGEGAANDRKEKNGTLTYGEDDEAVADQSSLEVSEARRLRVLEDENAKLKKLLAEAMLDNAMLKDLNSKKRGSS
jgi:hypothetical protein